MKTKNLFLSLPLLLAAIAAGRGQPIITAQPQSQTNVAGTTATFFVTAISATPLYYQWQHNASILSYATNAGLTFTNIQPGNSGDYSVVVTNFEGSVTSAVATLTVWVPPTVQALAAYTTNQSVSLGAKVTFRFSATGTPPLYYQWQHDGTDLPGKTTSTLTLANTQLSDAGAYTLAVTNVAGSATSSVATLTIDPTFTKITADPVVTNGGFSFAGAWGDYNSDGFIDLFVCNLPENSGVQHDFLYRNNGDGTFKRITNVLPVNAGSGATGAAWGDYDNDGNLDLFVARDGERNTLYHNKGNGSFTEITTGSIVTENMDSHTGIWSDFDNDGLLDLFIVNSGAPPQTPTKPNYLYRNLGGGSFQPISFGNKSLTDGDSWNVAAADFNNDGWVDLFIPQGGWRWPQHGLLYTNDHDGTFTLLTNSVPCAQMASAVACAWGDYDNDGFLDLFVSTVLEQTNLLYHNNGDGTFTLVTNSIVGRDPANSVGCAWGDYDNDGWLDLFVANLGPVDPSTVSSIAPENNFLYHNNGDGTFTKITTGSLVNDLGYSTGCAWGDYDNDGFLDLFVANGWLTASENDFLYHNNGNTNAWINFKLIGTASNCSAIGAKVRLRATVGGRSFWQIREISGSSNFGSQNDMRANFGLGDATNVDLVRIEWPSGIVQTLTNLAPRQFLTVVEHQDVASPPSFTDATRAANGAVSLSVAGDTKLLYVLEGSTNLLNWTRLGVRSNATGTVQFGDPGATNFTRRFYRVSVP